MRRRVGYSLLGLVCVAVVLVALMTAGYFLAVGFVALMDELREMAQGD